MHKYETQHGVETPDTQQEVRPGQGHSYKSLPKSSSQNYYLLTVWKDEEQQMLLVSHMKRVLRPFNIKSSVVSTIQTIEL